MLKFWNSENYITNATGGMESYLVYQDDDIPYKFYITPNRPTIGLTEANRLAFNFFKYRFKAGTSAADKNKGGGFVVFDVVLRVPDAAKADILAQIKAKYTKRLAKAAQTEQQAAENPTEAKRAAAAAARRQTDGVLDVDQIQIAPIPFQDGTVSLNIGKDDKSPFVQKITTLGKPSMDGNLTASFSAELTTEGATFFEKALSGEGGGVVQVYYTLKTWFRSSDTEITATYDKTKALKYEEKISHEKKIWSETKINQEFLLDMLNKEVIDVKVKWGDGKYSEEQMAALRKWATDAVAEAVKRETAELTRPETSTEVGRRVYDLKSTTDFTQTYRENFAMLMELHPQGMLPNIGSIANPAGGLFKWTDYFREVDLDDPFFNTLRLGVSTDLEFEDSPVSRLTVDLWCDSKGSDGATRQQHTTLSFAKGAAQRQVWDPFVSGEDYEYQYSIHFRGGIPPFVSKRLRSVSKEAVIGSAADGLLCLDVVSSGISYDTVVTQATVIVQAVDPTTKKKGATTRVVLTKDKAGAKVTIPVGSSFAPPYAYEYRVEYVLAADGQVIQRPAILVMDQSSQISVPPPFAHFRSITLTAPGLGEGESVFVELFYNEPGGHKQKTTLTLDSDNPSTSWLLGTNHDDGVLTYRAVFDRKSGGALELPLTKAGGDIIKLVASQAHDTTLTVEVDASLIDWEEIGLQILEVTVTAAGKAQRALFRVNKLPDDPPKLVWETGGTVSSYTWKAVYTSKLNGKISRAESVEQSSGDTVLIVPGPDDVTLKS